LFLGKGVATAIFDPQPHQPIDSTASCHCPLRKKRYIVHTPKQLAGNSNANASMGITSAFKKLLPRSNSKHFSVPLLCVRQQSHIIITNIDFK
jgi:hypothetical protein